MEALKVPWPMAARRVEQEKIFIPFVTVRSGVFSSCQYSVMCDRALEGCEQELGWLDRTTLRREDEIDERKICIFFSF